MLRRCSVSTPLQEQLPTWLRQLRPTRGFSRLCFGSTEAAELDLSSSQLT